MKPKIQKLKSIIEQAISECNDSFLEDVKIHLLRALSETKHLKPKSKENETPLQRWKFNLANNSLINMSASQRDNILGQIENMIENETNKLRADSPKNMLLD